MPEVVAVIQAFGDRINFHPHLHVLVTEEGVFLRASVAFLNIQGWNLA